MRNHNVKNFARPRRKEDEAVVQNNLSYTPSQMMEMAEQGIAISAQNQNPELFFDGVPVEHSTFNLPLERLRGVDVADCWQASMSAKKKAKEGLKNDIAVYGKNPVVQPVVQKGE